MQARQLEKRYTVKDYRSWSDDIRVELIDGVAYDMAPAPSMNHQEIAGEIYSLLKAFLKGKPCKAYVAPVDVYFSEEENDDKVVQPDVIVLCDPNKRRHHGIVGAPDIVVEVLSPSSATYDLTYKLNLYQRVGVPEYWAVSEERRTVFRYVATDGVYKMQAFTTDSMPSVKLPDFSLDIEAVFADIPVEEKKRP